MYRRKYSNVQSDVKARRLEELTSLLLFEFFHFKEGNFEFVENLVII
ncbi:hypothetical protein OTK01_001971 [Caldicellulosiruptor acetigenus]|nr:hypothetical protein [Caldicellulosiruptor acetigenus]WAM35617.1 hypothetical protein OTK01_001971 [Caldicellulosiruptor acetigenus]